MHKAQIRLFSYILRRFFLHKAFIGVKIGTYFRNHKI